MFALVFLVEFTASLCLTALSGVVASLVNSFDVGVLGRAKKKLQKVFLKNETRKNIEKFFTGTHIWDGSQILSSKSTQRK